MSYSADEERQRRDDEAQAEYLRKWSENERRYRESRKPGCFRQLFGSALAGIIVAGLTSGPLWMPLLWGAWQ